MEINDEARLKELSESYKNKLAQRRLNKANYSGDRLAFIEDMGVYKHTFNSSITRKFYEGLKSGYYKKPSEFIRQELGWLLDGRVPERFKEYLYYNVDNCIKWQYSHGYYRRSFRTEKYHIHFSHILSAIRCVCNDWDVDADAADLLSGNIPEDAAAYLKVELHDRPVSVDCDDIACELDKGNERLEQVLTDIIMGESEQAVTADIIRGIIRSGNSKMHELLGKLLLAARLQEGLRQSICENADFGTIEAFRHLLGVIIDNNLIRFSSVKRAVGTWTGLINTETADLERISGRTLELMAECIESAETRQKYLSSEDSMEIYMALWVEGMYEAENAKKIIEEISEKGTHHQLLTAGYFVVNLDNADLEHEFAKKIVRKHYAEQDIMAVFMPRFMPGAVYKMCEIRNQMTGNYSGDIPDNMERKYCELDCYFDSREEAEEYYSVLRNICGEIKGKAKEFSPCIFPWYTAKLEKSEVILRMVYITSALRDSSKVDEICMMLTDIEPYRRGDTILFLLYRPETELQWNTLTAALCDKYGGARRYAFDIMKGIEIPPENYRQMEDLLKYKAADARANIISLLYEQPDNELYGSVSRLLADKKEEKRTAALDIVLQLSKDEKRRALFEKCVPLAAAMENPTTKEKILIGNITGGDNTERSAPEPLFTDEDAYSPALPDNDYAKECADLFMEYFPDSQLGAVLNPKKYNSVAAKLKSAVKGISGGDCAAFRQAEEDLRSLDECIKAHRGREFTAHGVSHTVDCHQYEFYILDENGERTVPFMEDWEKWYTDRGMDHIRLKRMYAALAGYSDKSEFTEAAEKYVIALMGRGFEKYITLDYALHMIGILNELERKKLPRIERLNRNMRLSFACLMWFMKAVPAEDVLFTYTRNNYKDSAHLLGHAKIAEIAGYMSGTGEYPDNSFAAEYLALKFLAANKCLGVYALSGGRVEAPYYGRRTNYAVFVPPSNDEFISAAYSGIIPEKTMYWFMFSGTKLGEALNYLSCITATYKEQGRQVSRGRGYSSWQMGRAKYDVALFIGRMRDEADKPFTEEEKRKLEYAGNVYEKLLDIVLYAELNRGDSKTEYSEFVRSINRIYGAENFAAILSALGKDALERSSYADSKTKKGSLSHLLSVCIPDPEDNADKLRELIKDTDITEKRLIEAALYSPEWLDIVGEYLGWEGFTSACWYFMAHMNEQFDDKKKAIIAKYTPLTDEELNLGAFDIDWFRSAYEAVGEKRFNMIYDAAKYISDGAKHSRARKYADAVMGKMTAQETVKTVADKRNKDLLMAYALIPLNGEDDICERYLYLQQFLKESKKFGSQRSASEKKAVETAMQNLALNADYADVTRLTLRMETKLTSDSKELFEDKQVEDVTVRLTVDDSGKTDIVCIKGGKALKSIPAKLKKNEYIVRLTETKKKLTEQYRRTRQMFEQAMEDSIGFTVEELKILHNNPVVLPIIKNLVFAVNGRLGFLEGNKLTDYAGNSVILSDNDTAVTAHPYTLYTDGHWSEYQKYLFENKLVQPFKQVFRELYVKTAEEAEMTHSLRYAGNQIQPGKTVACLKSRRWVADVENGLQKVYYKEDIVAEIYAMADWFSPADIEAPTLEWVQFSHRKTGQPLTLKDIPDIIFSEVMRDVDLAVSVAHAGGVDPETSHSTVEMRAALLEFTLPLFKLKNVRIEGSHAYIDGKLASYTVHLGSGVVHKQGGAMIAILPVHSQHRGKLFLPFADDDPKTAEILTKVLFLAEDSKIKDPSIIGQIRQ